MVNQRKKEVQDALKAFFSMKESVEFRCTKYPDGDMCYHVLDEDDKSADRDNFMEALSYFACLVPPYTAFRGLLSIAASIATSQGICFEAANEDWKDIFHRMEDAGEKDSKECMGCPTCEECKDPTTSKNEKEPFKDMKSLPN